MWPGEALQPHNDAAYVTLSYGSGIPSADVTRATCVSECVCACECVSTGAVSWTVALLQVAAAAAF